MKPDTITGTNNKGVVFQDSDFEAGLAYFHNSIWPYCSWKFDGKIVIVGDMDISSWDELIIKLAEENQKAARWLLEKHLALANPKETILTLVDMGLINAYRENDEISIGLLGSPAHPAIAQDVLAFGWEPSGRIVGSTRYYKFVQK